MVQARQIAMYLAKKHTDFSTAKIGTLIGNKDHATVLHACKTIKQLKEVDKSFRAEIEEIQTALIRYKGIMQKTAWIRFIPHTLYSN